MKPIFTRSFAPRRLPVKSDVVKAAPLAALRKLLRPVSGVMRSVVSGFAGSGAIETYESRGSPSHLWLPDLIMPDLTGPVLAARLRSHQPDLQVLFVSGFHDADMVQRFVSNKGFSLLPKPFTVDGLLREVK